MKRIISILFVCLLLASPGWGVLQDKYFSVSGAGSANGSNHANSAALFSAGNWSSVITSFDFSTDGMRAIVEAGAYTCSQSLTTAVTGNDPTVANPLIFVGADSSGNILTPPNPNWTSDMIDFDTAAGWTSSNWPVIATSTNISTLNEGNVHAELMCFTSSGRSGATVTGGGFLKWCKVVNSTSNSAAIALSIFLGGMSNSILQCSGSSYAQVATMSNTTVTDNIRFVGNASASSGNRDGLLFASTGQVNISRSCMFNNPGYGFRNTSSNVAGGARLTYCTFVNNGSTGVPVILMNATSSQTTFHHVGNCLITGHSSSTYGVDGGPNAAVVVTDNRFRGQATGTSTNLGNYPEINSYTTSTTDADEFVDPTNFDFRIKSSAPTYQKGYGVGGVQAAASGGVSRSRVVNGQ